MIEFFLEALPWTISAITLFSLWLAGDGNKNAWVVALVNQALWLVYIFSIEAWGLLPMNFALWVVYMRNYRKWNKPILKKT